MPPYLRVDVYGLLPHHISKHTVERLRRPLELDHLARELVDPARHVGITPEDLALYLLDIVLEPVHDAGARGRPPVACVLRQGPAPLRGARSPRSLLPQRGGLRRTRLSPPRPGSGPA